MIKSQEHTGFGGGAGLRWRFSALIQMSVTGSTTAPPITELEELKAVTKTVRTGTDAQVDALYSRVLSTMSWYYTQFNASDKHEYATKRNWKEAMLQLSGKGISDPHMFANMLLKMTRRLLANPRTEHRGREPACGARRQLRSPRNEPAGSL